MRLFKFIPVYFFVVMSLTARAETKFLKIDGTVSDSEKREFEKFNDKFNQSIAKKDLTTLMSLYDSDFGWLAPNTPRSWGSAKAKENYQYVMDQPGVTLTHSLDLIQLSSDGTLATVLGTYTFERKGKDALKDIGKFQLVVARKEGALKIKSDIFNSDLPAVPVNEIAKNRLSVAKRFINDGLGKAEMKVFDETVTKNIIVRTGLSPNGPIKGMKAYKEIFKNFADAFPVVKFELPELFLSEDGEKVVARFIATAVFYKDYYGIKATNEVIEMEEVHILSFEGEKISQNIVSGTNFPFEFLMYPVLKEAIIGKLPKATPSELELAKAGGI